jgi:hypothetical protein
VTPLRYELGFYIPEDAILYSHCRENLISYELNSLIYFMMEILFVQNGCHNIECSVTLLSTIDLLQVASLQECSILSAATVTFQSNLSTFSLRYAYGPLFKVK